METETENRWILSNRRLFLSRLNIEYLLVPFLDLVVLINAPGEYAIHWIENEVVQEPKRLCRT